MTGRALPVAIAALVFVALLATASSLSAANDPPIPVGVAPDGVVIALCDTGVNYTLSMISDRLARDGEGELIGYDFHDDDLRPMDQLPGDNTATPMRHGTLIASAILNEAPNALIAPYRYRHGDASSFAMLLGHAGLTPARIVALSPVGIRREDWLMFANAARAFPRLLIIVSAATGDRDIDRTPLYPAALALDNILVVTATDGKGARYPGANFGQETVHIGVPVTGIRAHNFKGQPVDVSGPGFAVARTAALAARLLGAEPNLNTAALKQRILSYARAGDHPDAPATKLGWIAKPTTIARGQ